MTRLRTRRRNRHHNNRNLLPLRNIIKTMQFVDVGKIREKAEHEAKLERSIEAKKINKAATIEAQPGPYPGSSKPREAPSPHDQRKRHMSTRSTATASQRC